MATRRSSKAKNDAGSSDAVVGFEEKLWQMADKLRNNMDAAEYKHVVLGLIFLKYISDSFESRRDDLRAELTKDGIKGKQLESLLESRDEYTAERVFWVPPEARWANIQAKAVEAKIAEHIDDVPPAPKPYNGQFVQVNVVSVEEAK